MTYVSLPSDLCITGVASRAPWSPYCPGPSYRSVESGSLPTSWWFFPWGPSCSHVMGLCWVSSPPTQPYIYGCLYMCESQIWLESKTLLFISFFFHSFFSLLFMSPSILWQLSWNKGTYRMMPLNSTDHNVCVSTCVCVFKVRSQNVNSHEWSQSVRLLVEKHLLFLFTSFAISNI